MAFQFKLIILLLLGVTIQSCSTIEGKQKNLLVIIDVTAADQSLIPNLDRIMADINKRVDPASSENTNDGLRFAVALFDDVSGSTAAQKELKPLSGNTALDNPVKRKKEVQNFLDEIKQMVAEKLTSTQIDRDKSKIYSKLCTTLPNFIKSTQDNYVIVYSDMLENSELASFYDPAVVRSAANDPDSFYDKQMKSSCDLPELGNTKIDLFTSHTPANDELVSQAEKFWTAILKKKGAAVSVNP